MSPPSEDDSITEAILSGDPEERARFADWAVLGRYTLPTKLRAHGAVAVFAAVGLLVVNTLRAGALRAVLGIPPLAASVRATLVLAAGLQFVTIGTAGLVLVGIIRRRVTLDQERVERLLGVEETVSLVGLGTGGIGTLVGVLLFVLMASANPPSVPDWYLRIAKPVSFPLTYGGILRWAIVLAASCFLASFVFADGARSPEQDGP